MISGAPPRAGNAGSGAPDRSGPPGADWMLRAGGVLFGAGVLIIIGVFAAFAAGARDLPTAVNATAGVLAPAGLALVLLALLRRARRPGAGS